MFLTDYLPALRAALPTAVRAGLAGDGAPLARLIRESRRFEDLGSPRDFSVARYATVCETTPLPWDPGTPIEQRPAVAQQRIARRAAGRVRAVRSRRRRRGRDQPVPALAGRAASGGAAGRRRTRPSRR